MSTWTHFSAARTVLACAACFAATVTWAQASPGTGSDPVATEAARLSQKWIDEQLSRAPAGAEAGLRMEVVLGSLDDRLRLAPCNRVEPYIPSGARLWGRTRVGLRCLDGAVRWNVFLPVTVKAYGPAWVLKGSVPSGGVLTLNDAMEVEADWAGENSPVVADAAQWVGMTATHALMPGQVLRQSMVKPPQAFAAGAQVRVVAVGPGFQVTADGQALGPGVIGQLVKVRMDNGRVMSGSVLDKNTVKIEI